MKAWQLESLGGALRFVDRPVPEPRAGAVTLRMQASVLMSYMQAYVEGRLPIYHAPEGGFIPGGNGVGIVHAVGADVWHLSPGQRVVVSSHWAAHENVRQPAQMLIGITAQGEAAQRAQAYWRDGTLAEYAEVPATVVTAAQGLDAMAAEELAKATRFAIPYGGLLRGRLAAGETVVVSGATGAYGSAAVLLALALGAARVVAIGRSEARLRALAGLGRGRVATVVASGDARADAQALRAAAGGGADLAFDMVGNAADPQLTLAALRSLLPGGRLVLMGSMQVDLPLPYTEVMLQGWEVLGQFMHPRDAWRRLLDLLRAGLLDLGTLEADVHSLADLPAAMRAAAAAGPLHCVVMRHEA